MNNKKELKERIENAEKELEEMKALLLEEPRWKTEDIYSGLHVKFKSGACILLIKDFYDKYTAYEVWSGLFEPFDDHRCLHPSAIAIWLNEFDVEKMPDITTSFKRIIK